MDKKKLKKLVDNPRHIPGIHNYCDRWCERCTKTLRCSVFAMTEAEGMNNPESRDPDNEVFWKYMHDIFAVTMEMVQDYAEKHNIDLNPPTPEELEEQEQLRKQKEEHPLSQEAMDYMDKVGRWFGANEKFFEQVTEQFKSRDQMRLPGDNFQFQWYELYNAFEVVQWYYTLASVKLRRAVHGLLDPHGLIFFWRLSDGS